MILSKIVLSKSKIQWRSALSLTAMLTIASAALPVRAESIDAGKAKAASCTTCHGANGITQIPGALNLAGQQALYTSEQFKNFRSGQRANEIMNVIAKPLSDAHIADLSAWFESIKPEPTPL